MSLYDYFNSFSRYIEAERPPDKAIVLYWALLDMFNRRGWPEWAVADKQKLALMCHTTDRKVAERARDTLSAAGFLEYEPGKKKGQPTQYRLLIPAQYNRGKKGETSLPQNAPENPPETESGRKKGETSLPTNAPENAVILIKTKTDDLMSSSAFSKTETTTSTTGAAATDWSASSASNADSEVIARFLDFLPEASTATRKRMAEYCRKLGAEVCLRAIEAARDAAPVARNRMAYLFGILRNREADGIRSGAEWDAHERERRQRSRDAPGRNPEPYPPPGRTQEIDPLDAAAERLKARLGAKS